MQLVILQGFGGGSIILQGFSSTPTPPEPIVHPSDNVAFQAILDLLSGTKEFDQVLFGRRFDLSEINTNNTRIAHVQWVDTATSPDGSIERDFNAVTYALTLALASSAPAEEITEELDRISRIARNVLLLPANKNYGGFCIPRCSRLSKSIPNLTQNPISTVRLIGQFAYSVDLTTGYLTVTG